MKRRFLHTGLLTCLLAGTFAVSFASPADSLFERGNASYRAGRYAEAAAAYQAILDGGRASAEVYFNLGNAYYRQNAVAKAILAFERAERLQPTDDDIRHNLQLARLKGLDRIDPVPDVFFVSWLRSVSAVIPPVIARRIFLGCWVVLFSSLIVVFLARNASAMRFGRLGFFTGTLLALLFGGLFLVQVLMLQEEDAAIVTGSVVTVKSSPDPQSVDAFVIHEGLKVRVSDAVGEWVKITLADGKVGWMHAADCEMI